MFVKLAKQTLNHLIFEHKSFLYESMELLTMKWIESISQVRPPWLFPLLFEDAKANPTVKEGHGSSG